MARVLLHEFRGGEKAYIEPDEDAMIRRIAEVLARNIVEIEDPDVVDELISCLDATTTLRDAEVALEIYCDEVPDERLSLSVVNGVDVEVETAAPPVEDSVVRMRQQLDELLDGWSE